MQQWGAAEARQAGREHRGQQSPGTRSGKCPQNLEELRGGGPGAMGESEILVLASSHLQPELVSPGETYKWVLGKEARPVPDVHDCVPSTKLGVTAAL